MKIKILCFLLMTSLLCTLTACKEAKKGGKELEKQAGDSADNLESKLKRLKKEVSDVKDLDF